MTRYESANQTNLTGVLKNIAIHLLNHRPRMVFGEVRIALDHCQCFMTKNSCDFEQSCAVHGEV